ncbi:MAG: depupylase/deamidase Dop [Cellulomonas sp.]
MTTRRVMGIETEYGVLQPGHPMANPMLLSSHVVAAHAVVADEADSSARGATRRTRARWDYDDEDPLHDARGFRLQRASAHPSLLTDDPVLPAPSGDALQALARPTVEEYEDPGAANVILTNGSRLYVDHAHPEYSSPEVTTPLDAVRWDRAGELVMLASVRALAQNPVLPDVALYKNNVDGKGATYGTHENYMVDRAVPFTVLAERLTAFLVTRQVFTGAGRVGLGQHGQAPGFQLSQRADYIEAEVGLETTLRRPIVNTRDEPHADPERWRRLHLIIGDANLLEVATYLKLGTTSLVLWVIEHAAELPGLVSRLDRLALRDPVEAVHVVSHDLALTARLPLADGRQLTALEIQQTYLDVVCEALATVDPQDDAEGARQTADVVARWGSLLGRLATDPTTCVREVEWLAKLRLLDRMRRRDQLAWDHPQLSAVDLQWSDVRPERGLYQRLRAAGAVEVLVGDAEVERAVGHPPDDTRAYFRGETMARYGRNVSAMSWDSVVFDVPGAPTLQRVPMRDPWRGTRAHVGPLLDRCPDAAALLAELGGGRVTGRPQVPPEQGLG